MDLKLYSFVLKSEQRRMILSSLSKGKTPTQISKDTKLSLSHVSRTLREFKEKKIVTCLTPNERTGKIYELTESGNKIRGEMLRGK